MNERIKELQKQAGGHSNISKFRGCFLPPPPGYIDPATVDLKKFAELIVRECAEVARLNTRIDSKVYLMIKEHFGVEE